MVVWGAGISRCPVFLIDDPITFRGNGVALDGNFWYYTHRTTFGRANLLQSRVYPTMASPTTLHTATTGANPEVKCPATDGTNIYFVESDASLSNPVFTIYSLPIAGGSPTAIYTSAAIYNLGGLIWHPTNGLLYFLHSVKSGSNYQQNLYSMTTAGASLTSVYASANAPLTDGTHIEEEGIPFTVTPDAVWGMAYPSSGILTDDGIFRYPLGGTLAIGARQEPHFTVAGLKDNTVLAVLVDVGAGDRVQKVSSSFSFSEWGCQEAGASYNDILWSAASPDFGIVTFSLDDPHDSTKDVWRA